MVGGPIIYAKLRALVIELSRAVGCCADTETQLYIFLVAFTPCLFVQDPQFPTTIPYSDTDSVSRGHVLLLEEMGTRLKSDA